MKPVALLCGLIIVLAWSNQSANGQTLNEKLILEDPAKLVEESKDKGDVVRGAILFHQGNINCANCHRPVDEKDRIGPDLSRLPKETTDISIVESILVPSKTINDDYQSTTIRTTDGKIISGLIVSENEQQIVLRTGRFSEQMVTIKSDDIEERRLSTKSSMPDGLVNEIKSRRQFLDLLRYVIELRANGPITNAVATPQVRRELSDELKGRVLIDHLNCTACHVRAETEPTRPSARAANLKWSASNLNPDYLVNFIADPQKIKPGTRMPHLLSGKNEAEQRESAKAIVHFLLSAGQNQFLSAQKPKLDRDSILRGHELFHNVGCIACHLPREPNGVEIMEGNLAKDSIPLGDLAQKHFADGLTEFLKDPHVARPSGRMPNMVLSHREAKDLTSFLLQSNEKDLTSKNKTWEFDATLANRGKQLFTEHACYECHTDVLEKTPPTGSSYASDLQLDQLDPSRGCLAEQSGNWPRFQLTADERMQIRAALKASEKTLTASQQIDVTLSSFRCTACHTRNNLGGVAQSRRQYFQTTNLNLGEQGRIPPTLTGVGAKLKSKWMRDVLVNHRSIRPYMKTRMPQYGEGNVGHLVEAFKSADQLTETKAPKLADLKKAKELGHEIVGNRGLNCVACHTYQFKISDTMPAVDLTEMSARLEREWFTQYMLAPQKFSPNTVMPSYWPNGRAIRSDLPGDPTSQVASIWQYLLEGRQARAPRGVIRKPLEIVVNNEARMLRRSYEGIGKRGIGVGYPGDVNLAYDAEQMRLAMTWQGKFVDPSGVWYGQGHGRVRTLGKTIQFPKGPELDDQDNPWLPDSGRPPEHQFQGYVLDKVRRPEFRYRFEAIDVSDKFIESSNESSVSTHLIRRIKMTSTSSRERLRFRIATDEKIEAKSDQTFQIGNRLVIKIESGHVAMVVNDGESKSLHVPLKFAEGETQELKIAYRWKE